ncbi:universal stress protein [Rhizobium sp. HT1-10]|uniref:universal stress protein n=1 Tax=Rhizobium sp. HT1-10 TaxID=3111638 RepID=UPI003C17AA0B
MTYKTIVIILDAPENAGIASDFGLALAAAHSAHVIGLHAEVVSAVPMVAPMEIPDPIAVQALQDMARTEAVGIEELFRNKAAAAGCSFEWRSFTSSVGYATQPILETVRSADLIIAVQADPANPSDAHIEVESFLFESGRPVLMVPYVRTAPVSIQRVLIAWNGSKEAARATFDALPFLMAADAVEVLSVDPSENANQAAISGADLTATLIRHGVKATLSKTVSAEKSASQVIETRLVDDSVDLLVMGAYTHSRLWQMIFGGTTKAVLKSMTALTLLSR